MTDEARPKVQWKANSKETPAGRWEPYAVIQIETPEGYDFEPIWGPEGADFATREEADRVAADAAREWLRKFWRKFAMKPKQQLDS